MASFFSLVRSFLTVLFLSGLSCFREDVFESTLVVELVFLMPFGAKSLLLPIRFFPLRSCPQELVLVLLPFNYFISMRSFWLRGFLAYAFFW